MRALQWKVKQVFEWLLAILLLVLTLPLQLLLALAIRLDSPGPALFRQDRLGKGGRVFRMWKFRTLRWEPGAEPVLNPDGSTRVEDSDARLTRVGRFLRLGFDELPQLVNVVRGEMALIGPRPDQPFHRAHYEGREAEKLRVLPGITGLPQALGRNAIPWKERIRLDLYYIEHYSLWLDLKIVAWTAWTVLTRRGVHGPEGVDGAVGQARPR
jgi:undecaprenyl phosphate N,N'-diacetylbacillosamine 1-phosphate transferase